MVIKRDEIIAKRSALKKIDGYKTLEEVGFDGPWVTPYQISSDSSSGPVLVALHWLDDKSIEQNRMILNEIGYLPSMPFNKVLDIALSQRGLTRSDIYMTQAFHLIPRQRSARIPSAALDQSFGEVTRHELVGRKVIALGNDAAGACNKHGIPHIPVCHPSRRGHKYYQNAAEIAEAFLRLGF